MVTNNIVITKDDIAKRNREKPALAAIYDSDLEVAIESNVDLNSRIVLSADGKKHANWVKGHGQWVDSIEYIDHWDKINWLRRRCKEEMEKARKANTIVYPNDYFNLIQAVVLDITRRRMENADFTSMISAETTNLNAQNPMNVKSLLPYTGKFGEYQAGQAVNMIQQKTGGKDTFDFTLYAIGFERDLYSVLFDMELFDMQRVMDCVARSYTGLRNDLCLSPLLNANWQASQIQPASVIGTNGVLTFEHAIYDTLLRAWRRLVGLFDMQTGQEIDAPRVILLVRNAHAAWAVNAVVNGYLKDVGTNTMKYLDAIPIDEIWTYKGDSWWWFNDHVQYNGVANNTGYLFVPGPSGGPFWTVNKMPLTQRIGQGPVLTLGQEQRAWAFGQGNYYDLWLGSSGAKGASAGATYASGYGYCVKIEWPTETEET